MNVYMKEKTRVFCQNSFDDLDDNIGIVMPILTECDVDEDFTEGIEKVGDTIPILPLRNMVLFPGVALPVIIGRPKSMRLIKEAVHKKEFDRSCLPERDGYGRSGFRGFIYYRGNR